MMNKVKKYCKKHVIAVFSIISIAIGACDKLEFTDVIIFTGTETHNVVRFPVEASNDSYNITATATGRVTEDITVSIEVDESLVEKYNSETSSNFYVLPRETYELSTNTSVIKTGNNVSEPISLTINSLDGFAEGRAYIIPVRITNVSGPLPVLESSRVMYIRLSRIIDFTALDISNSNFYATNVFENSLTGITEYTYEIKCYINSWHTSSPPISRLSNWGPVDESLPNLLRFGEAGSDRNQLQFVSAEGGMFSNTRFDLGRWYTISITYNGSQYRMLVDGVVDNTLTGGGQVYDFSILELGMSYGGYQFSQRFLGKIAEVRFWNRALSTSEIQSGLCGVDPASNNLVAYWKLNEGNGNVFHDVTGNGRDMEWPNPVVWNMDDDNRCAQ